jgi:hypothetical protein
MSEYSTSEVRTRLVAHICNEPVVSDLKKKLASLTREFGNSTPEEDKAIEMHSTPEENEFDEYFWDYVQKYGDNHDYYLCTSIFFGRYFNNSVRIIDVFNFLADAIITYRAFKRVNMLELGETFMDFAMRFFMYSLNIHN